MIDLSTSRLVLGQGVIGSYLIDRFEREKLDYRVMDIGEGISELPKFTSTASNINCNLGASRNSFLSNSAMVWGRGLMMVPENEIIELEHPIATESFKKAIENVCQFFLDRNSSSLQTYKIEEHTLIDSLIIPKNKHDKFFLNKRKSLIADHMALEIIPEKTGFTVKAINMKTGSKINIHTRELFITLGAVETVRLLLNSKKLFNGEQTEIGQHWKDHVSCQTATVYLAQGKQLRHLSPRMGAVRKYPRFYHDPQDSDGFGGFSFLDFNPFAPSSRFKEKLKRNLSGYELATGHTTSKTLLETEESADCYMELREITKDSIPSLRLNFNVTEKFIDVLRKNSKQFTNHLKSSNAEIAESIDSNANLSDQLFDSLHPTGVLPVSDLPKVGGFNSDFEMHGNPGLFCFSTGLLPRAFSTQPTLSGIAFAEMYLTRLYGRKRTSRQAV
jgi:hypothetical protein